MIVTITLNPSIDQHIYVKSLVKDDANRASSIERYPGGKGLNVSKVIRELGGRTRAYAIVGGFVGKFWISLLKKIDVSCSTIVVDGNTRINTIITDTKDHTQTRISAPGPLMVPTQIDQLLKKILLLQPKPFLCILGGSLSTDADPSTYKRLIVALQKHGVPCILDADNEALKYGIEAKPFMIKPNEYELQRLFKTPLKTIHDYADAGKKLVRDGVTIVVISLGAKGALFVSKDGTFHVLTPKVSVKSKVGAGDALIGGFALGLEKEMSLKESARLGVAASTSAVMREAPRLCLRRDIKKLLPKIKVKNLE